MLKQKKTIWILGILLLLICLVYIFTPSIKLAINRSLWEIAKPPGYCIYVVDRLSGLNNRYASCIYFETDYHDNSINQGAFSPQISDYDELTVDLIFDIARRYCTNRGFLDCEIRFDSTWHYPTYIESYELVVIEIVEFIPCYSESDCLSP